MRFIKGYTTFGNDVTYKFIILNDILIVDFYSTDVDMDKITHLWTNFWNVISSFKIKYYINFHKPIQYNIVKVKNNYPFIEEVTRQFMKNELRCNRFDSKFETFLTGEK